jgi:hypothetical protein
MKLNGEGVRQLLSILLIPRQQLSSQGTTVEGIQWKVNKEDYPGVELWNV